MHNNLQDGTDNWGHNGLTDDEWDEYVARKGGGFHVRVDDAVLKPTPVEFREAWQRFNEHATLGGRVRIVSVDHR